MAKSTFKRSSFKLQRSLGIELPGLGKAGALERKPYPPGQHGNERKKISDYSMRLKEKQKLKYHYALKEKQLVNYVRKAKKDRSRAWMDTLLITLERRLNNVIFRLNFAPSIASASQMVRHGHVFVNGKKVTVSGYLVEKGDVITLSDKAYNSILYMQSQEKPRIPTIPACYNAEKDGANKVKASLVDYPIKEDIPFAFEDQLVTEYFWRI